MAECGSPRARAAPEAQVQVPVLPGTGIRVLEQSMLLSGVIFHVKPSAQVQPLLEETQPNKQPLCRCRNLLSLSPGQWPWCASSLHLSFSLRRHWAQYQGLTTTTLLLSNFLKLCHQGLFLQALKVFSSQICLKRIK